MKRTRTKITLYTTIFIILAVLFGLFSLGRLGFNTLSGVRAYVGAEGIWAKNQKDASYQLVQYLQTKDRTKYEDFLSILRVPLGDKKARLELEKKDSDDDVIISGFFEGGNHPDDIAQMITLYKRFKNQEHFRKSIEQWHIGDQLITELIELGETIQRHISSGDMTQAVFNKSLARIDDLQSQLTIAENQFSFHMGMASRWTVNLLVGLMITFTIIGTIICAGTIFFVRNIIVELNSYSDELEITAKTEFTIKKELMQEKENLQKALDEIKTLRGIIPICGYCKQIRDDKGAWDIMEAYITKHSDAKFSHGICPNCYKREMEKLDKDD